ncbi:MAG: DpnD/PcfM family protein [Candidatus Cloacimonetes bacterium]|nr:DpnD/PcfM family protein [Candidatus Cloacimonadota bacterium]
MKTFKIEIKEVLSRVIDIDAKDLNDAILKARYLYDSEEIVLDAEDYSDTSIDPVTNNFEVEKLSKKNLMMKEKN